MDERGQIKKLIREASMAIEIKWNDEEELKDDGCGKKRRNGE